MKNLIILLLLLPCFSYAQEMPFLNLDMEKVKDEKSLPDRWMKWGGESHNISLDKSNAQKGEYALRVFSKDDAKDGFGSPAFKIPAKYKGSQIELTGFMKTKDVEGGFAGLLLRIDGESGVLGFDNMESRQIKGTNDWKEYSITMEFPKGAKHIYLGGLLVGKGEAWFDNFDVIIDGKSVKKLKPVEPELTKVQMDKEFDKGSRIEDFKLTNESTQALATLGKIWGFVKYYHPEIAKGNVNWDYELFRVLPKYLKAKNSKERTSIVIKWIEKIGQFEKGELSKLDGNLKLKADYTWFAETNDKNLVALLNEIKIAKRDGSHHFMSFAPNVGNPIIKNEAVYADFKYPDVGFRILSLYRYWNIINYFFPYKHLTDEKWDNVILDFVPKFVNAKNEIEYKLAVLELIGKVQDTHANIWQQDEALGDFFGKNISAVKLKMIEEKPVVIGYYDDEKGKLSGLQIGDIITTINGKSIAEIVKSKLPHLPASNYPTQLRDVAKKLLRTDKEQLEITYLRNGSKKSMTLPLYPTKDINTWGRPDKKSWEVLEGDIGYIYPGTLKDGDMKEMKKGLLNKKGIVIDLRCYPSKFMVFTFGSFLASESTAFVKFTSGSLKQPGNFSFSPPISVGSSKGEKYQGKVAILINEQTQSQAEYTTMAFQVAPNNKVFGSTTAGADGNVSEIFLPGKIRTMISGIGVYYPDGRETQRIGIVPDVEVKPTIKGFSEGRDEVMEKALEWINQ